MKLSMLPVSLFGDITSGKMSVQEWARLAKDVGLDGFDVSTLFFQNHTAVYIDGLIRELDGVDIERVMVCTYPDFTNPDPMERMRQEDYLRRDIALASKFGFKCMRVTAGMDHPGVDRAVMAENVVDSFKRMAAVAEKYGIQLLFENHAKPGAWPIIDFSFKPENFLAVCEGIRGSGVGVNFDLANAWACGTDPVAMLEKVIDLVKTVHMCDTLTPDRVTPTLVGTGIVDVDAAFAVLNRHGFDGWVCVEEASGLGTEGIRRAAEFARKYVR